MSPDFLARAISVRLDDEAMCSCQLLVVSATGRRSPRSWSSCAAGHHAAGDIYELHLPTGSGHDHRGRRLGVVVQSPPDPLFVEQLGAVDVNRLGDQVRRVAIDQQWAPSTHVGEGRASSSS